MSLGSLYGGTLSLNIAPDGKTTGTGFSLNGQGATAATINAAVDTNGNLNGTYTGPHSGAITGELSVGSNGHLEGNVVFNGAASDQGYFIINLTKTLN